MVSKFGHVFRLSILSFSVFSLGSWAGCYNDFQCTYGQKCVKPEGSYSLQGLCVIPVDSAGFQDYTPKPIANQPQEVSRCSFNTDCSLGDSCIKRAGELYGICVK